MLRIHQGDSTAFEVLYRKYLPLTATYAAALGGRDASVADIVQETFARLWARRQEYRGEASIRTYIHAYVRNICLEEKRLQAKTRVLLQRLSLGSLHRSVASSIPETAVHLKEMNERLEQVMARLSNEQKQALQLYYVQDLSLREAAISIGCTQKCFESRLYRGLARLRCLLLHPPLTRIAKPGRYLVTLLSRYKSNNNNWL
ncbi:MAG: RNA polymerase sigma factor [Phycisphaerae bacterium]|nr:RNA polymerase sigma factor [Phycisphaerae bacterium]